jgi:hypothetical protein
MSHYRAFVVLYVDDPTIGVSWGVDVSRARRGRLAGGVKPQWDAAPQEDVADQLAHPAGGVVRRWL